MVEYSHDAIEKRDKAREIDRARVRLYHLGREGNLAVLSCFLMLLLPYFYYCRNSKIVKGAPEPRSRTLKFIRNLSRDAK